MKSQHCRTPMIIHEVRSHIICIQTKFIVDYVFTGPSHTKFKISQFTLERAGSVSLWGDTGNHIHEFFNSLAPGRCGCNFNSVFLIHLMNWYLKHWYCSKMDATEHIWLNTGSGNGLVPSANKPLPEPMLKTSMLPFNIIRPKWVKGCVSPSDNNLLLLMKFQVPPPLGLYWLFTMYPSKPF